MRFLRKIMVFSLIIVIPILILCLAANITLRAPDVYQYSLKATQVLTEQDIDAQEDEMGEVFSDYLLHITPEFQMTQGLEGEENFIFTKNDQHAMGSLRMVLDIAAIVCIVFIVFTVISYVYLIRTSYKEALRWSFIRAAIVMAVFVVGLIVLYNLSLTGSFVHEYIFNTDFGETDMLPMIMNSSFSKTLLIVSEGICVILTIVAAYVTWSLTKPKRMFF